jgi:hypothetical protein
MWRTHCGIDVPEDQYEAKFEEIELDQSTVLHSIMIIGLSLSPQLLLNI